MASAPQPQQLPLFYNQLEILSSQTHADYRMRGSDKLAALANTNAVPVTVEEFPFVQRNMPIVFTLGEEAVPLALMGLNEGVNTFFDDEGKLLEQSFYVPAYIRRYPYLLTKLRPDSDELSLCFDPTSDTIGAFEEGEPLFTNGEPSETTKAVLEFNRSFEEAFQRTQLFMKELQELDLLMDGEVSVQPEGAPQPFVYRGFRMIDEKKLNDLRGDQLRKMTQNGMLPLIYAHLFSLSQVRDVFARQMQQGKMPPPNLAG